MLVTPGSWTMYTGPEIDLMKLKYGNKEIKKGCIWK